MPITRSAARTTSALYPDRPPPAVAVGRRHRPTVRADPEDEGERPIRFSRSVCLAIRSRRTPRARGARSVPCSRDKEAANGSVPHIVEIGSEANRTMCSSSATPSICRTALRWCWRGRLPKRCELVKGWLAGHHQPLRIEPLGDHLIPGLLIHDGDPVGDINQLAFRIGEAEPVVHPVVQDGERRDAKLARGGDERLFQIHAVI